MSTVFCVIAAVCVLVVIMQHVDAACYKKEPDFKLGNDGSTVYITCVYDGVTYNLGQKWLDKKKCRDCRCRQGGSKCCSITGTVTVGDTNAKCINVIRNCKNVWVVKGYESLECPECWIPKMTGMSVK